MILSRFSLVMATLGRVAEIEFFLQSLAAQTHKDYELIIVDQNPDDRLLPVVKLAQDHKIDITHIRQTEPNLCLARNTGISSAKGNVIAFPDDDCWYERDLLEKVNVCLAQAEQPDGAVVHWIEQDPIGQPTHWLSKNLWRQFRGVPASSISLFFKSELIDKVGVFDLKLGVHSWYGSGEETDLMFRILDNDGKVMYLPDAIVHHPINKSNALALSKALINIRKRARGTGAIYAKHQLSSFVILRGFFAPIIKAHCLPMKFRNIISGFFMSLGRVEGFIGWHFQKNPS